VPRDEEHDTQVKWLYDWWQLIDGWISEHRPPGTESGVAGAAGETAG
jgi:hypothetical protein